MEQKKERVLLHEDGTPVKIGDTVTSFRGDKDVVTGWPHTGGNRVWTEGGEYFPSVFNLKWADE